MDYKKFFDEIKKEYKERNLEFKWNWEEAQSTLNLNFNYVVFEKISKYPIFDEKCRCLGGGDGNFINQLCVTNHNEFVSFLCFYLSLQMRELPHHLHSRMIFINPNDWSRSYFEWITGNFSKKSKWNFLIIN